MKHTLDVSSPRVRVNTENDEKSSLLINDLENQNSETPSHLEKTPLDSGILL